MHFKCAISKQYIRWFVFIWTSQLGYSVCHVLCAVKSFQVSVRRCLEEDSSPRASLTVWSVQQRACDRSQSELCSSRSLSCYISVITRAVNLWVDSESIRFTIHRFSIRFKNDFLQTRGIISEVTWMSNTIIVCMYVCIIIIIYNKLFSYLLLWICY